MRRSLEIAIAGALIGSVALNVYLWRREPTAVTAANPTLRSAAVSSSELPVGLLPVDIDAKRPCPEQLAEVEARIAAIQPEITKRLKPEDKFNAGVPNPALEAEFKPVIATLFADAPDDFAYELVCQDRVCRIAVVVEKTDYDWVERVQGPELRKRWSAAAFTGMNVFLELRDQPAP